MYNQIIKCLNQIISKNKSYHLKFMKWMYNIYNINTASIDIID